MLGCKNGELFDVLRQQVLSIAEQAVPFWGPMLTKKESYMIERILKTGLHIIYQSEYKSFGQCLKLANMKSLSQRRKDIIFKFSRQAMKSKKFNAWFKAQDDTRTTRTSKPRFKPVTSRTVKYERTALPVITKAVLWHPPLIYISPNVN